MLSPASRCDQPDTAEPTGQPIGAFPDVAEAHRARVGDQAGGSGRRGTPHLLGIRELDCSRSPLLSALPEYWQTDPGTVTRHSARSV